MILLNNQSIFSSHLQKNKQSAFPSAISGFKFSFMKIHETSKVQSKFPIRQRIINHHIFCVLNLLQLEKSKRPSYEMEIVSILLF